MKNKQRNAVLTILLMGVFLVGAKGASSTIDPPDTQPPKCLPPIVEKI